MRTIIVAMLAIGLVTVGAGAAVTSATTHSPIKSGNPGSTDDYISSTDCLQGKIPAVLPGDMGWHPANTDPLDQLPAFTDGAGMRPTGLTGLLNDWGYANPVKLVAYDMTGTDCNALGVARINIHSSNNIDGRIFSTTVIKYSMDGGSNYSLLGYFQSDPSGTINSDGHPNSINMKSTMVSVFDDLGAAIIPAGVTNIEFDLYSVDNTQGEMRDPFDGVNPFTGVDDGLTGAFESPLIMEIDVFAVPEPAGLLLLALGSLLLRRRNS
ncbi:MAG: hypothetical protein ACUVXJ_17425 [Phycisphaerae bacterium]